ncbi:MAG: hypothetical protein AB7O59_17430 [Pirellulales bacterium]
MKKKSLVLAVACLGLLNHAAYAQRSAGSKMLGTAYEGWSGGMYQSHAYDHAVVLQNYAAAGEQVPQEVARRHVEAVRSNLMAAKKSYANLATAHKDDATAAKHLAAIDEHHTKALALCDKIDTESAKGDAAAKGVHECCSTAADHIKAAQAEHDKLMKHLKVNKPTAGAKPAAIK